MVTTKKVNVSTPANSSVKSISLMEIGEYARARAITVIEAVKEVTAMGYTLSPTATIKASPVVVAPKQEMISITIRGVTVQVPVIEQETAKGNPSLRASTWTNVTVDGVVYNIPPMSIPMTAPKEPDTPKPTKKAWLKAGENHLAL